MWLCSLSNNFHWYCLDFCCHWHCHRHRAYVIFLMSMVIWLEWKLLNKNMAGGLGSRSKRSNSASETATSTSAPTAQLDAMRIQTRQSTSVSGREANDSSPFLGVSNNSNGSSFRSDLSRSGEGGYIYLVEVQYYLRLNTGQVRHWSFTDSDCIDLI